MSLQITDNTTGKTYRVPEDMDGFSQEFSENPHTRFRSLCFADKKWYAEKPGWYIFHNMSAESMPHCISLDPTRFQVSFEGMVSEERVKEVLTSHYNEAVYFNGGTDLTEQETVESIAENLKIKLTLGGFLRREKEMEEKHVNIPLPEQAKEESE